MVPGSTPSVELEPKILVSISSSDLLASKGRDAVDDKNLAVSFIGLTQDCTLHPSVLLSVTVTIEFYAGGIITVGCAANR